MKIKHWQGYGCVKAKKVSCKNIENAYGQKLKELVIRVEGNHEWGLDVFRGWDKYGVYNWLVKKFDKTCPSDTKVYAVQVDTTYETIDGVDTEICTYKIYIEQ